jgi:uncharacterized protein YrrD
MTAARILATERLKIRPGAQVISGDVQVGRVERVVFRPDSHEVVGIIVSGWIVLSHDVYVPIEAIESSDDDAVHVSLTLTELEHLPPVGTDGVSADAQDGAARSTTAQRQLRPTSSGRMAALAGGRPLRAGQKVVARDGEVGQLDLVLVDPRTDRAAGFVVRKGVFFVRDVIVPVEWIKSVQQDRITLVASKEQLERLPEYRPDDEITRDVLDALWYGGRLGPADVQFVDVHTRDGIIELTGHTHTEATKQQIERVVREVRGVLDVRNYLDTFEALQDAVREAQRGARARGTAAAGTGA